MGNGDVEDIFCEDCKRYKFGMTNGNYLHNCYTKVDVKVEESEKYIIREKKEIRRKDCVVKNKNGKCKEYIKNSG